MLESADGLKTMGLYLIKLCVQPPCIPDGDRLALGLSPQMRGAQKHDRSRSKARAHNGFGVCSPNLASKQCGVKQVLWEGKHTGVTATGGSKRRLVAPVRRNATIHTTSVTSDLAGVRNALRALRPTSSAIARW